MNDDKLLRQYVEEGSYAAFDMLVERHLRMVYSICLRMLGDKQLAEDATQVVFLVLAEKASSLPKKAVLSGWLFQTARFASQDLLKREARRRHYEQQAAQEQAKGEQDDSATTLGDIAPLIDEMLARLRPLDREAILLRFYESREFAEVAGSLGVSEQAARMRVSRALTRIRGWLAKEGVAVSGAVLLTWLSSELLSQPPLMAADIATRALDASAAGSKLILCSKGVLKTMLILKLKMAATIAAAVLLTGAGAVKLAALAESHAPKPVSAAGIVASASTPTQKVAPQILIKQIIFTANTPDHLPSIPVETLKSMMATKQGKVLDSDVLSQDLNQLFSNQRTGYSHKQGYIIDVSPDLNVSVTGILTIPLIEAHIQAITVRGNKTVPTETILRVMQSKPGDVWNQKRFEEDLTRVYKLGQFDRVLPLIQGVRNKDTGDISPGILVIEKSK